MFDEPALIGLPILDQLDAAVAGPNDPRRRYRGPTQLNVYQSTKCNLSCSFCLLTKGGVERATDVTPELLGQVLETFPTIKSVTIAGFGEPLVSPTLFDNVKFLKEAGKFVTIITNGILVPMKIDQIVESQPNLVSVSVNAANEADYIALVEAKEGDYEKVLAALQLLHERGIATLASFVITKLNYKQLPEFAEIGLSRSAGVTFVNILPGNTDGYRTTAGFWDLVITDEDTEILRALDEYKLQFKKSRVEVWPRPISRTSCPSLCDSPFSSIGVDGRGFVSGCRRVEPPSRHNGTFDLGYGADYFKKLRAGLLGEQPLDDKCKMCFGNWQ